METMMLDVVAFSMPSALPLLPSVAKSPVCLKAWPMKVSVQAVSLSNQDEYMLLYFSPEKSY